jgi:hypothetical protein
MKNLLLILLVTGSIGLYGSIKDTTRYKLNIKESSRILAAIDNHIKYDEFDVIEYYLTDTLFIVMDRKMYQCNNSYAIDMLKRTRSVIKNNDYKYKLKIVDDSTYDYIYIGYYKHIVGGYTKYDKYEVTLEFTENKDKIIFIAIILSAMDDD